MTNGRFQNERSLQAMLQEIKNEIRDFVLTRFDIFKREMQEKLSSYKAVLPMAVVAALLVATSWFLITGAIVAAIAMVLGWALSFLMVGFAYLFMGMFAGWAAYKDVTSTSVRPERTLQVLKQDQVWIQQEVRSA